MVESFLGLGSNKGDRFSFLKKALEFLNEDKDIKLLAVSTIYETRPFGVENQRNFLNAVALVKTSLEPRAFLNKLKSIEKEVGRREGIRWGPREIDIDILLYGNLVLHEGNLNVPHKGLTTRDFFLFPLLELKPDAVHPESGKRLKEYLEKIETKYIIGKFIS